MPNPSPLPDELPGAFSVSHAAELGVSPRRLRASDLVMPFRGVRAVAEPLTQAEWCAAYVPRLAPGQFFTHLSAAVLWGFPLSRPHETGSRVHVGAVRPAHPPKAAGVTGHLLPAGTPVVIRRGLPLLAPIDTWSYLGTTLSHRQLVVAGDYLVRKRAPLATLAELTAVASVRGRPGIRAVRDALADVRTRTESPKETELRLMIVEAGLPEPVVAHTVTDAIGDFVATPDLAYVRERIAIEYEGLQHFTDPHVYAQDIVRYELLEEAGWLVVRVIGRDLAGGRRNLLVRLERALARRA